MQYSKEIAEAVKSFCRDEDINFLFDEQKGVLFFTISNNGVLHLSIPIHIFINQDSYHLYADFPFRLGKKELNAELATYICKLNHSLFYGCYEYMPQEEENDEHGHVRFYVYIPCRYISEQNTYLPEKYYFKKALLATMSVLASSTDDLTAIMIKQLDMKEESDNPTEEKEDFFGLLQKMIFENNTDETESDDEEDTSDEEEDMFDDDDLYDEYDDEDIEEEEEL